VSAANTPAGARAAREAEHVARRGREHACALDFLVYGDEPEREPHAARCVFPVPCSRDYDPLPYAEAEPVDLKLYEGTSIGALYGMPGGEHHLGQLAGWNVRPRSTHE
jgi:hypothetical protein